MARYIATVEFDDGRYWISFPGIQKAGSHAARPEDIIPHASKFLTGWTQDGGSLPASLDDAITDPKAPFKGVRLVVFDWDPPAGYRPLEDMSKEEIEAETARILARNNAGKSRSDRSLPSPRSMDWSDDGSIVFAMTVNLLTRLESSL